MTIVASSIWVFLLLAFALGAIVDYATRHRRPRPADRTQAIIVCVFCLAAVILAIARVLPGRNGLALEIGVLLLGAYFLGAAATALVRRDGARRNA